MTASVFEVSRPVKSGGDSLLKAVRFYGNECFGEDRSNGLVLSRADSEQPRESAKIAGEPRFRAYGKLMLHAVQLVAPENSDYGREAESIFYYMALRIMSPHTNFQSSIRKRVEAVGLEYDVPNQDKVVTKCSQLGFRQSPHPGRQELVVYPDDPAMLKAESERWYDGLAGLGKVRHSGIMEQFKPSRVAIGLGLLPADARTEEVERFTDKVSGSLPARLVLGRYMAPSIRQIAD